MSKVQGLEEKEAFHPQILADFRGLRRVARFSLSDLLSSLLRL
jgi:hypothetical protein